MPTQKPRTKRKDRRVQRTEVLLRTALIQLLNQHDWDAVSVQQVCERARVGRSTFYAHYADKEDLLISGFGELKTQLRKHAATRAEPLAFTLALLEHTTEYADVVRALAGSRTADVVQREFLAVVTELVRDELSSYDLPASLREGATRYIAGAFCELLRWWGSRDAQRRQMSAKEVDEIFRQLTLPVLRQLRRRACTE